MRFTCLVLVLAWGCYDSHPFEGVLPPRDAGTDGRRDDDVGPRSDVGPRIDSAIDAFMPRDAPPIFDAGPGGDRCTGGETFVWALGVIEPIMVSGTARADGFDLDDRVSAEGDPEGCFQRDFVAFDGTRGIDNQFAALLPTLEGFSGPLGPIYFELFFSGEPLVLIEARHVDDLRNDDCIDVLVHRGRYDGRGPPRFEMINYAPGQLFRSFESFRFTDATIERRTLNATGGIYPFDLPVAGTTAVNRLRDARVRADIVGDQLSRVLAGGRWPIEAAIESIVGTGDVPPEVVRSVLESIADLEVGPDGLCTGISVGIRHANGVDAVLR